LLITFSAKAQFIDIPLGDKPEIDGIFDNDEWDDAAQSNIYVQTDWTVTVFYKHSDTSLYFAFTDIKGVFGERYPDVMLDISNDKTTKWNLNDWWLHASYNDCEANGTYNVWSSCQPTHTGWCANNFPLSAPGIIEMEISYKKIGLAPQSGDTIGLALEVSDTYTDYHYFPATASIHSPSTWGNAVLSSINSIPENDLQNVRVKVFPNPSRDYTCFSFPNPDNDIFSMSIFNASGNLLQNIENITGSEERTDNSHFANGMYFYRLQSESGRFAMGKFMIQ
jgi:hypothetical protein